MSEDRPPPPTYQQTINQRRLLPGNFLSIGEVGNCRFFDDISISGTSYNRAYKVNL